MSKFLKGFEKIAAGKAPEWFRKLNENLHPYKSFKNYSRKGAHKLLLRRGVKK